MNPKDSVSLLLKMAAKMYSYISLQSRATASKLWLKVSALSLKSPTARKAHLLLTLSVCKLTVRILKTRLMAGFFMAVIRDTSAFNPLANAPALARWPHKLRGASQ